MPYFHLDSLEREIVDHKGILAIVFCIVYSQEGSIVVSVGIEIEMSSMQKEFEELKQQHGVTAKVVKAQESILMIWKLKISHRQAY